jgi:CRP/FNR family transcriptional regulator, cyclic AMP receptor protein
VAAVKLKKIPRLRSEQREALTSYGARTTWPAGFTLYERGATADGVFVVLRGQVVLRNQVSAGRTFVPWVATVGETFGGEGLEREAHYTSSARAEDETETLHLTSAQFSELVRERPAQALALVRQMMAERSVLLEKFGQHATLTVEQRLISALIRFAQSREDMDADMQAMPGAVVPRRLLGELVGATRESISLVLGRLTGEDLIRRSGNGLVITDLGGLVERLNGSTRGARLEVFREPSATEQRPPA